MMACVDTHNARNARNVRNARKSSLLRVEGVGVRAHARDAILICLCCLCAHTPIFSCSRLD
jgi:hypothetical protein